MNRNDWIRGWYGVGGIPLGPTDPESGVPCNVLGGVVWIESEGSTAKCNPLDSEQGWPGATNFNSVGVKNYPSTMAGWAATTATLHDGFYTHLIEVLMDPLNADELIAAIHDSPWGSKPTEQMLNNTRNNWPAYANAFVSGTGNSPIIPTLPSNIPPIGLKEDEVLIAMTPSDNGYWECKADGSIYTYGDALYFGGLNYYQGKPAQLLVPGDTVTGFTSTKTKQGYIITTAKGFAYPFGGAPYLGSVA